MNPSQAILPVLLVALAVVGACSSSGGNPGGTPATNTPDAAATSTDLNGSAGALGGSCTSDADCKTSGHKCLTPAGYASGSKYCAPTCTTAADCSTFEATSYAIEIPLDPDGFGDNQWGATVLKRGVTCGVSEDLGGAQKYCEFICPENSAIEANGKACACLPRYKMVKSTEGKFVRCEWSDDSVCSIVQYPGRRSICDACNSKPLLPGCYTGDYRCAMNRSFNGDCLQWFSGASIDACIAASTSDCDADCSERCLGSSSGVATSENCTKLCCKTSTRPASTPPECKTGPSDAGGASSSSSSSASSSGTSASSSGTSASSSSSGGTSASSSSSSGTSASSSGR